MGYVFTDLLSIGSIGIMIERWIFFRRHRVDIGRLFQDLGLALEQGDFSRAQKILESNPSVEAAIVKAALHEFPHGPQSVAEMLSSAQLQERVRTERGLTFLGTLGNNAPFIGLFGTVLGIIQAFHQLSLNAQGGAATVMGGISERWLPRQSVLWWRCPR